MKKAEKTRVGWFDIEECILAAAAPPEREYAFAILGPHMLKAAIAWGYRPVEELLACNVGTDSDQANDIHSDFNHRTTSWGDAQSQRGFATQFIEVREKLSNALSGITNTGVVLLDATTISKTLLASVVGLLIRTRAVRGIDIAYQPMDYTYAGKPLTAAFLDEDVLQEMCDVNLSTVAVPYIEGKYRPALRRHFIMLAGLDYQRILAKVQELEPARVDIIIEEEAASLGHLENILKLTRRFDVTPAHIRKIPRCSVAGVIASLRSVASEAPEYQSIILSGASKPFALAASIYSVLDTETPMLSTIPDRVLKLDQNPHGPPLLYRLRDRTSLL